MSEPRRFPLPWTIGVNDVCYWVQDAEGKRLCYVYFIGDDASIGTSSALRLKKSEAHKIARNVANLPALLKKPVQE